MPISTRITWTQPVYDDLRYQLIKLVEESGHVSVSAYIDGRGIPTIGLGFNIGATIDAVLRGLGVANPQDPSEASYRRRILSAVTPGSFTTATALQTTLNKIMADRAADPAVAGIKRATFSFANEAEVKSVFNSIAPNYNAEIVKWERKYRISSSSAVVPSLPLSPELLVLFSLSYNNPGALLGRGLAQAMLNGNRAEAWYEIRYGSNAKLETGVAKRRYIESEIFGLYDNPSSVTLIGGAGNDTYRMTRGQGRDTIIEDDATAGNRDAVQFASGITADQLWFRQVGNNLEVSIIGTEDKLTLNSWYAGSGYHVEEFRTSDGHVLIDTQVQNLVQAMASFAPPAAGQTTLPQAYQNSLAPLLAADWR